MKCLKCQHENPDGAKFCNECASALKIPEQTFPIDFTRPHSYTPKFLADKILTTRSAMEGERKRVTVLFADVAGFTSMSEKLDPEEVHQIMDGCFKILMDEIHNHQGTINQFTGDGVMALFGAPVAIENHAQNACQAALAIQSDMKKYSEELNKKYNFEFKMRIGLNTGPVIVGSIGDDLRMDYTAIGDTTNLAARMESMSEPGSILVSPITYKRGSQFFKFEPLGKVTVKGKEEPLDAYKLVGKIERPCSGLERQIFSEMVGRDNELNKLGLQVAKAIDGEGSIVNIIGEAGIGKSRLIAELKNRDVVKRVTVLEGRAISIGRNLSFHPILSLLKYWARIKDGDSSSTAISKLETSIRGVCQEDSDEIFPFVAALMGMKLSGRHAERLKGIEGESLEKLIFKNMRDLLIKTTELTPLVVVIEDLHWADNSSIELLESMFRLAETRRIVFINVFRPNHPETGERIIETIKEKFSDRYIEIHLQPLNEQKSEDLVNNMLNIRGLQHAVVDQIIQRAGGNPFFIEEVVRSFIDTGAVVKANGEFKVTEKIEGMVIPHTINDVLMARIDRLEDGTRNLVKIASVIGRSFFYRILIEVAKTVDGIDNRLSYLKGIELIRERRRMEELEYLFKHALAQEAAYESILLQKRKELHLHVADSIEKIFTDRLHEFYGVLSYHYLNGDNLDKAEEYMLKAGEEAMKSSASSEALHYYKRAIELYIKKHGDDVDKKRIAEMEENIANAFLNKGLFVEAVDYFDRASINRGEKIQKNILITLIKIIISFVGIIKNLYLPSISKKKIPTELENQDLNRAYKVATALISTDIKRCFLNNIEALNHILHYDISKSQVYFNMQCGGSVLFSASGISFSIARQILKHANRSIDKKNKGIHLRLYTSAEQGLNFLAGNWYGGFDEDMVNTGLKSGDLFVTCSSLLYSGYMKIAMGDFEICERIIDKTNSINKEYNYEHAMSDFYVLNSILSLKKGKTHDAITYANKGALHEDIVAGDARKVELLGIKSRIEIAQNNLDDATKTLEEAKKLVHKISKDAIMTIFYCQYLMGKFLLNLAMLENAILSSNQTDIGKYKKAALRKGKIAVSFARKKVASERTEACKLMGRYYWLTNQYGKALKWWNKSINEGESLGAKIELSRTYFEVGKSLLEPNSKYKELNSITAEEYLDKAKTIFEEMDLPWDLDELDKVIAAK